MRLSSILTHIWAFLLNIFILKWSDLMISCHPISVLSCFHGARVKMRVSKIGRPSVVPSVVPSVDPSVEVLSS